MGHKGLLCEEALTIASKARSSLKSTENGNDLNGRSVISKLKQIKTLYVSSHHYFFRKHVHTTHTPFTFTFDYNFKPHDRS